MHSDVHAAQAAAAPEGRMGGGDAAYAGYMRGAARD